MGCVQKSISSDPAVKNQEKEDKYNPKKNDNEPLSPTPAIQTGIIRNKDTSDSYDYKNEGVDEEGKENNPIKTKSRKSRKKEVSTNKYKNKKAKPNPNKSNKSNTKKEKQLNYKHTKVNIKEKEREKNQIRKKKFKPKKKRISIQKTDGKKKKEETKQYKTIDPDLVEIEKKEKEKEKKQQPISNPKPKPKSKPKRKPKRKPKPANKISKQKKNETKKQDIVEVDVDVDRFETTQTHVGEEDEGLISKPTPGENWNSTNDYNDYDDIEMEKTTKPTQTKKSKQKNIVVVEKEDEQLISNWKIDNDDTKQETTPPGAPTNISKKRNDKETMGTDIVAVQKRVTNDNDSKKRKAPTRRKKKHAPKRAETIEIEPNITDITDIESETDEKQENKEKKFPWSKWDIEPALDRSERRASIGSPREFEIKRIKKNKTQNDAYSSDNELEIKRKKRKKKKKKNIKKNDDTKQEKTATPPIATKISKEKNNKPIRTDIVDVKKSEPKSLKINKNDNGDAKKEKTPTRRNAMKRAKTVDTDLELETEEKKENTGKAFPWSKWDIDHGIDRSERRFSIGSPREFEIKQKRNKTPDDIYSSDNELEIKRKKKKKKKHIKKNNNDHTKKKKTPTRHAMKRAKTVDIGTNIADLEYEVEEKKENDAYDDIDRSRRASIGSPRQFEIKQSKKSKPPNDIYSSDNELEIKRKKRKKKKKKHALKRAETIDFANHISDLEYEAEENKENKKTFPWTNLDIDDDIDRTRRASIGSPREFEIKEIKKFQNKTRNEKYSSDNEFQIKRKKRKKKKKKHAKKRGQTIDMGNTIYPWSDWETDMDMNDHIEPKRSRTERRASICSPREYEIKQIKKNKVQKDAYSSDNELEIKRKKVKGTKNEFKVNVDSTEPLTERRREKKKRKLRAKHRTSSLPPYDFKKYNQELIKNVRTESKRDLSTLFNEPEKRKKSKKLKNLSRNGFEIHINHRYKLIDGRIGVCKYRGRTVFGKSSEDWIGLVVEVGVGEHNGSVKGKRYFRCRDGKGLFVRPYDIIKDMGSKNKLLNKNDFMLAKHDIKRYNKKEMKHITTSSVVITNDDWGNAINPDHGDDMWNEKSYNPKTLLDKNKGMKVDKKNRHFEV